MKRISHDFLEDSIALLPGAVTGVEQSLGGEQILCYLTEFRFILSGVIHQMEAPDDGVGPSVPSGMESLQDIGDASV